MIAHLWGNDSMLFRLGMSLQDEVLMACSKEHGNLSRFEIKEKQNIYGVSVLFVVDVEAGVWRLQENLACRRKLSL